jgi:TonB family protein
MKELNAPMIVSSVKKDTAKQVGKIKVVKGKVVNPEGKPLSGATIIIRNTNTGVITDKEGNFKIKNIPIGGELVISFEGYQTTTVKSDAGNAMLIKMEEAAVAADEHVFIGFPISKQIKFRSKFADKQPLYLLNGSVIDQTKMDALNPEDIKNVEVLKDQSATDLYGENAKNGVVRISTNDYSNKDPLFVLDGEIINKAGMNALNPNKIQSINVLKDGSAIAKYGNKGGNGVIEITSKGKVKTVSEVKTDDVFLVVEEMPEFPGGKEALANFLATNIKYPAQAKADKKEGKVIVNFIVNSTGKVINAKIISDYNNEEMESEALRVICMMPDWKPGKEKGVAVKVSFTVPVVFKLQ